MGDELVARLPRRENVHLTGAVPYDSLPSWLSGIDVALMPFAINESTRFISPTKTLEYLAAGSPVVSTSIRDVVHPYGEDGLVHVSHGTPHTFATTPDTPACFLMLHTRYDPAG